MIDERPKVIPERMYQLIRQGKTDEFNRLRETEKESPDFSGLDFRAIDLRGFDVENIDFSNCYFRQSDLRGLNMKTCIMEGASIHGAHISGTYFPRELSSSEIRLSLQYGTRMRYRARYDDNGNLVTAPLA